MITLDELGLTQAQIDGLAGLGARPQMRDAMDAAAGCDNLEDFMDLMMPRYIRSRVTKLMCEHIMALYRRDIQKLAVLMQPRSGKTDHCIIYGLPFMIGNDDNTHAIITSYGDNRAWEISQKARDVVSNANYPFRTRLNRQVKGSQRWWTTNGGEVNAAGLTGSITGKGAARFFLDDAVKDWEEANNANDRETKWNGYLSVVQTRLERFASVPTFILSATRWHDDDLVGRILNSAEQNEWTVLKLPALATPTEEEPDLLGRLDDECLIPELGFTQEIMEDMRRKYLDGEAGGPDIWYALYQQDPVPRGTSMFNPKNWGRWAAEPHDNVVGLPRMVRVEHLVDTSFGEHTRSDFTAWATVGKGADNNFYWLGFGKKRMLFPERVAVLEAMHKRDQRRPLVLEKTHSAHDAISFLRARGNRVIAWDHKNRPKEAIAEPVAHFQENGKCFLPEGHPALGAFIDEHARFPKGKFDDWVTTTCMALERLARFSPRPATQPYYVGSGYDHRNDTEGNWVEREWGGDPFGKSGV